MWVIDREFSFSDTMVSAAAFAFSLLLSQVWTLPTSVVSPGNHRYSMAHHGSHFVSVVNGERRSESTSNNFIMTTPGSYVTMNCGVFDPSYRGDIYWTKTTPDGTETAVPVTYYQGSPLNIRLENVSEKDSGIYTCYVGNEPQQKTDLKVSNSQSFNWNPEEAQKWQKFVPNPQTFNWNPEGSQNWQKFIPNPQSFNWNPEGNQNWQKFIPKFDEQPFQRQMSNMAANLNRDLSKMRADLENMWN